jgi:hypothetical protein
VTTPDPTKKLASLLRKLKVQFQAVEPPPILPDPPDEFDALVHQLVFSMLLWEASTGQAKGALRRIRESVVDYNELRVCVPDEVAHVMGDKYPLAHERAMRLRSALNDIYHRQHSICLKHLPDLGRREARAYLDSLEGMPPYVSGRVCLIGAISHAVPVDDRLCELLVQEQVLEAGCHSDAATTWLERHVRAEEALESHLLLQAWSDEHGHAPKRDKRPVQAPDNRQTLSAPEKKPTRVALAKGRPAPKPEPAAVTRKSKAKPRSGS